MFIVSAGLELEEELESVAEPELELSLEPDAVAEVEDAEEEELGACFMMFERRLLAVVVSPDSKACSSELSALSKGLDWSEPLLEALEEPVEPVAVAAFDVELLFLSKL